MATWGPFEAAVAATTRFGFGFGNFGAEAATAVAPFAAAEHPVSVVIVSFLLIGMVSGCEMFILYIHPFSEESGRVMNSIACPCSSVAVFSTFTFVPFATYRYMVYA